MKAIEYNRKQIIGFLNDLEKMKKYYILSLCFPFLKKKFHTEVGLCYAYKYIINKQQPQDLMWDILFHFAKTIKGFHKPCPGFYAYETDYCWFDQGKIRPRLKLLNKTIKYFQDVYEKKYGD